MLLYAPCITDSTQNMYQVTTYSFIFTDFAVFNGLSYSINFQICWNNLQSFLIKIELKFKQIYILMMLTLVIHTYTTKLPQLLQQNKWPTPRKKLLTILVFWVVLLDLLIWWSVEKSKLCHNINWYLWSPFLVNIKLDSKWSVTNRYLTNESVTFYQTVVQFASALNPITEVDVQSSDFVGSPNQFTQVDNLG